MKTRLIAVDRIVTLSKRVVIEVPAELTNEEVSSALYDRCNLYDVVERETDKHDMREQEEQFELTDFQPGLHEEEKKLLLSDLREALIDDEIVHPDLF